jgi:hypothetical protein
VGGGLMNRFLVALLLIVVVTIGVFVIDLDRDGLHTWDELRTYNTNPVWADSDDDGVSDGDELKAGLDPLNLDSDEDGLSDGEEVFECGTDPLVNDTDGDYITDGIDPNPCDYNIDHDRDNLSNDVDVNPVDFDSDDDGLLDGESIRLLPSDNRSRDFLSADIVFRQNSEGTYTFFGEEFFESDPLNVSLDEVKQAKFLSVISEEEYERLADEGNLLNYNLDGDLWSNYFEEVVNHTPYNVSNNIHVVLFTAAGREYEPVDQMYRFFEEIMELPEENLHAYCLEDNNQNNFWVVSNAVKKVVDENDIALILLGGEGAVGYFGFYGLSPGSVPYSWIAERLININSMVQILIIDSCHSGSAIPYLESFDVPRIILTGSTAEQTDSFGTGREFLQSFLDMGADKNGDGYVSIGEAVEYAKQKRTFVDPDDPDNPHKNSTPQISDRNNIGSDLYLIEYEVSKEYPMDSIGGPFDDIF